ncbi:MULTISPECIES: hypothetical protein [Streptococcus]|nr:MULTISPECIES: hypothetical protein [Streptococcus]
MIQNVPKRHEYHPRKADPEVFRAYTAKEESSSATALFRHSSYP